MKGTIEAVTNKEMNGKFGKQFIPAFKIGDDWYSFGFQKKETTLKKGDVVEFEFTVNDKGYKNVTLEAVKVVAQAPYEVPAKGVWDKRDEEIKAGMFFNKAVDIAIAKHDVKVTKAAIVQSYRMCQEAYEECRKQPEEVPAVKLAKVANGNDFDDDLPF